MYGEKVPANTFSWIHYVSPLSPLVIAQQIRAHWDDAKAVAWEAQHGTNPVVAFALGSKYAQLRRWTDAERCFNEYIASSPDLRGYEALADIYRQQNQDDRWLATLSQFLLQPDYSLQHAWVQVEIAHYYMARGQYEKALPYADAAAQTASGWAMVCDAGAHTGVGDWDGGQQIIKDEIDHYSDSPFRWYAWCLHTGHGDRAAAAAATRAYFTTRPAPLNSQETLQLACLDMLENRQKEALQVLSQRVTSDPGAISPLHMAIIADAMNDTAARDSAMKVVAALPDQKSTLAKFGAVLNDAMQAGSATPDTDKIDAILTTADAADRISIFYLAGRYLENHGNSDQAVAFYRRCMFNFSGYNIDLLLDYDALRHHGLDPMKLEQAVAGPTTRTSLEP